MNNRIILILLYLIVGCSKPTNERVLIKEPINYKKILVKDDDRIFYTINTNKPYSGDVFSLYDDGKKKDEGALKNGRENGGWTYWHENGQKRSKGNYKNGDKYGKWTYFYQNKQKTEVANSDGTINKTGHRTMLEKNTLWYKDGQKWQEGTYKDGKEDGLWTIWYESGQKKMEAILKDGELISDKCWDEDGNKIECN
ncbi:MAG TPA: hypothetical protein EYO45_04895 [Candidatus Marinimicrobia bacterium]|mgnify:CR=1 FL=1|nr:hypothetical protein [Candidatus Neomarinimicrobiota bacterium]